MSSALGTNWPSLSSVWSKVNLYGISRSDDFEWTLHQSLPMHKERRDAETGTTPHQSLPVEGPRAATSSKSLHQPLLVRKPMATGSSTPFHPPSPARAQSTTQSSTALHQPSTAQAQSAAELKSPVPQSSSQFGGIGDEDLLAGVGGPSTSFPQPWRCESVHSKCPEARTSL